MKYLFISLFISHWCTAFSDDGKCYYKSLYYNFLESCHIKLNGTKYDNDTLSVLVGDSVTLYCTCGNITGQWITDDEHHYVNVNTGELSLLPVRENNEEKYTCERNNNNITIYLTVPGMKSLCNCLHQTLP